MSEGMTGGKGKALCMGGRDTWMEEGTDGRNRGRWREGVMNVKRKRRLMKRLKAKRER